MRESSAHSDWVKKSETRQPLPKVAAQRLAQPALCQVKLVFGGVQLGDLLAHKSFAPDEGAGAEVETQGVDHELLGEDHAQVGGLAHALAQPRREVAPVNHRVEHLAGVHRVEWVGVLGLRTEHRLVIGARAVRVLPVVGPHAGDGSIDGQVGIDVARLAQIGIGLVDPLLERHDADGGIGVVVGGGKAAVDVKLAHQLVKVVVCPVGGNIRAKGQVAGEQAARLRLQRLIIGVEERAGVGQLALVHRGKCHAGGAADGAETCRASP